jgi:hypothetical protein
VDSDPVKLVFVSYSSNGSAPNCHSSPSVDLDLSASFSVVIYPGHRSSSIYQSGAWSITASHPFSYLEPDPAQLVIHLVIWNRILHSLESIYQSGTGSGSACHPFSYLEPDPAQLSVHLPICAHISGRIDSESLRGLSPHIFYVTINRRGSTRVTRSILRCGHWNQIPSSVYNRIRHLLTLVYGSGTGSTWYQQLCFICSVHVV